MKIVLPLLASLCLASGAYAQDEITFTSESYPPFSCVDKDGVNRGAGVEQIAAIMGGIAAYRMKIVPWARAIALAETTPMHCVFAAARTPERKNRFKWVVPLFIDRNVLVARSGSGLTVATIEEAKTHVVGTHREDYTEAILRGLGFTRLDLSADFDITLHKLLEGRIELMPMSQGVFEKLRADGKPVEEILVLATQPLGLACNIDMPDELIARMQASLDAIIADETQERILISHGLPLSPP